MLRPFLLLAALAASGCAAVENDPPPAAVPEPVPASEIAVVAPENTVQSDPLPPASLLTGEPAAEVAPLAPPPSPPIEVDDNPDRFLEKSGRDVNAALGAPGFIRRDGPAEVWQYAGSKDGIGCILDIYLYSDTSTADALWVKYVELRGASATRLQRRACFAEMLRRKIQAETG